MVYLEKCFIGYPTTLLTWDAANDACSNSGGDLASYTSLAESQKIQSVTGGVFSWVGLSDRYYEGQYMWTDLSTILYFNWSPNYPTNLVTNDCVLMDSSGALRDVSCTNTQAYVCQYYVQFGKEFDSHNVFLFRFFFFFFFLNKLI